MAEYSQEDADEVFRHVYATLKAAIDFLIEMKVANPEDAKRFSELDREMIDLHTSLEELWIDYDADEQEEKEQEHEDMERADISKIMKEDAKAEVEEENEQNERLGEEEIRADYKLPPGWPLDYPK
jgi:predicted helicase